MPWWEVVLTTAIPCSEVSALDIRRLQCVQNSLARIVDITPVRKSLYWLPVLHRSVFKTALLVYKFLHSGHPKYFEPFLKPRHSVYRTRRSQSDGVLLEVPHCASLALHTMPQEFGMIFLTMYAQLNLPL